MQTPTNRAEQNWVLGVTALASFMMALDAMIITTAFALCWIIRLFWMGGWSACQDSKVGGTRSPSALPKRVSHSDEI